MCAHVACTCTCIRTVGDDGWMHRICKFGGNCFVGEILSVKIFLESQKVDSDTYTLEKPLLPPPPLSLYLSPSLYLSRSLSLSLSISLYLSLSLSLPLSLSLSLSLSPSLPLSLSLSPLSPPPNKLYTHTQCAQTRGMWVNWMECLEPSVKAANSLPFPETALPPSTLHMVNQLPSVQPIYPLLPSHSMAVASNK